MTNLFKAIVYSGAIISLVACNSDIFEEFSSRDVSSEQVSSEPISAASPTPSLPVTEIETPVFDESLKVLSADLIDVTSGNALKVGVQDGETFEIAAGNGVALKYNVPESCNSISMSINDEYIRLEESVPFCSGGDNGECLSDDILADIDGTIVVDVQCFSGDNQSGQAGPVFSKSFSLSDIDTDTDTDIPVATPPTISPVAGTACDCGTTSCTGNSVSYTRDGYTIGFDFNCDGGACRCGKFANEWDYWVAPLSAGQTVTITEMTPAQTGTGDNLRNGAELNPSNSDSQGFNGHVGNGNTVKTFPSYLASLTLTPPYSYDSATESDPDVIVKSISSPDDDCGGSSRICLQYVETLTLLSSAPTESVFRPPYFGDSKPDLILASSFDDSILSSVASLESSPTWQEALDGVQSTHLEYTENWNQRQSMHSRINHGDAGKGYEASVALKTGVSLMKLNEVAVSDTDKLLKRRTALAVAQLGIDLRAIHISDTPCFKGWPATGGFGGGKLGPIIFAANLLNQTDWLDEMNTALSSDISSLNCFSETGYIQPALGLGKDIPLFGMRPSSYAGTSCSGSVNQNCASGFGLGVYDGLSDGDLTGTSGSPTTYQKCCTHGYMLATAMSFWMSPKIMENMPSEVNPFLLYMERSRQLGVENGSDFGAYNNRTNYSSVGFDTGYDTQYIYDFWNAYKACADTNSCTGL